MNLEQMKQLLDDPPGAGRLRAFVAAVERGETPDPDILQTLAVAFRAVLAEQDRKKRGAVLLRALELTGSKGRKLPTEAEAAPKFEAAVQLYLERLAGRPECDVVGDIAEAFDVDDSTVRRWVREYGDQAESVARWIHGLEQRKRSEQ